MGTLKKEQKGCLTRFHSYIFKDPSRWLMLPFPRLGFAPWEKDACSPRFASSNDAKGRPASAISQKVTLTSSLPPSFFSSFLSSNSYLFYFPGGGGRNTWDLLSSQISSTHYSIINFVSMLYITLDAREPTLSLKVCTLDLHLLMYSTPQPPATMMLLSVSMGWLF